MVDIRRFENSDESPEKDEYPNTPWTKDIGDFALYSKVDGVIVERTTHRDHVLKLFNARLPESVTGRADKDILETVHIKREKNARQPEPAPVDQPQQASLF